MSRLVDGPPRSLLLVLLGLIIAASETAAGPVTAPDWSLLHPGFVAQFGLRVDSAGDVNGDGFGDVIIGAEDFENGEFEEGAVFVVLGSASGLSAWPAWFVEGNQVGANFGRAVAAAGDVNGDGFDDVLVGARLFDTGETDAGRAFLYLGSATGLSPSPAWTAEGNQATALFGYRVDSAGDVNDDGYADIIVVERNAAGAAGRVHVFHGSPAGPSLSADWTVDGDQPFAPLEAAAGAGDVNGDGFSDVIVAAPRLDTPTDQAGRAYVYLGSASGLAGSPVWTADGAAAETFFGQVVAGAGDVNGDGFSDVVLSGYDPDSPDDTGRVDVYFGAPFGVEAAPGWTVVGEQDNDLFGARVASAGGLQCRRVLRHHHECVRSRQRPAYGRETLHLSRVTGRAEHPHRLPDRADRICTSRPELPPVPAM